LSRRSLDEPFRFRAKISGVCGAFSISVLMIRRVRARRHFPKAVRMESRRHHASSVISGWVAGRSTRGPAFGIIGDLVIGVISACIGGVLAMIGSMPPGTIGTLITPTIRPKFFCIESGHSRERKIRDAALQLMSPCRASY
jgi:uncharacterized membrane protein YeaQ/YmgE (transglycosylase-associated protein family)